jgi:hypothetical protein
LEPGFSPWPFYRAMVMYIAFTYISLGQLKLMGRVPGKKAEDTNEN